MQGGADVARIFRHSSYFMQRPLGLLSTHYPASRAELVLQDELVGSLAQLGTTEPGSRLLQACLACLPGFH